MLWACASLGHGSGALAAALARQVTVGLEGYSLRDLATASWSLAVLSATGSASGSSSSSSGSSSALLQHASGASTPTNNAKGSSGEPQAAAFVTHGIRGGRQPLASGPSALLDADVFRALFDAANAALPDLAGDPDADEYTRDLAQLFQVCGEYFC